MRESVFYAFWPWQVSVSKIWTQPLLPFLCFSSEWTAAFRDTIRHYFALFCLKHGTVRGHQTLNLTPRPHSVCSLSLSLFLSVFLCCGVFALCGGLSLGFENPVGLFPGPRYERWLFERMLGLGPLHKNVWCFGGFAFRRRSGSTSVLFSKSRVDESDIQIQVTWLLAGPLLWLTLGPRNWRFLAIIVGVQDLELTANGGPQVPKGSKRCFPNGFATEKNPWEGRRMPENSRVLSILVPSAVADPDQPLNAPLWKTPFRKHRLLLLGS